MPNNASLYCLSISVKFCFLFPNLVLTPVCWCRKSMRFPIQSHPQTAWSPHFLHIRTQTARKKSLLIIRQNKDNLSYNLKSHHSYHVEFEVSIWNMSWKTFGLSCSLQDRKRYILLKRLSLPPLHCIKLESDSADMNKSEFQPKDWSTWSLPRP